MKRAAIEKAIWKITRGNYLLSLDSNSGYKEVVDGLEVIQDTIKERPSLNQVDFDAILNAFVRDFGLWMEGRNGQIFFRDPFMKESNLLLKEIALRQPIPMIKKEFQKVIDELFSGSPRHEFRKEEISLKGHYTKKEAAVFLNVSPGRIDQLVSEGKLEFMKPEYNRKNQRVIFGADLIEYLKNTKH